MNDTDDGGTKNKNQAKKIIFVNTHPIQYFAPLYAYCNKEGLRVDAWYCSDESIRGEKDVQFGRAVKWDIPLLDGYPYRFFKNYSWKPSIHTGFFGLINIGMMIALFKEPKSIIIVHGWGYLTLLLVIMFGKLAGHTVCLRSETPYKQEKLHSSLKLLLRKLFLQQFMFSLIDKFLFVGKQNKEFYKHYGVKNNALIFVPYAVDNNRFDKDYQKLKSEKENLKESLGIPLSNFVIIYSGKYIPKKRPIDLLKAFHLINNDKSSLVMIGEGELREQLEQYIADNKVNNVNLTGFINQSSISSYYAIGDVFVMCSQEGETWGLSINEAMNFELPVVASDLVGSTDDLIVNDETGYTYKCGNVNELSDVLGQLSINTELRKRLGRNSKEKIDQYSYKVIKNNLQILLQ
jgi:glycosyltransferase involved in cell wall biosynthesis